LRDRGRVGSASGGLQGDGQGRRTGALGIGEQRPKISLSRGALMKVVVDQDLI